MKKNQNGFPFLKKNYYFERKKLTTQLSAMVGERRMGKNIGYFRIAGALAGENKALLG